MAEEKKDKNLEERTDDIFTDTIAPAASATTAGIASIPFIEYVGASMGVGFGLGQIVSNIISGRKNTVKDISYSALTGIALGGCIYAALEVLPTYFFGVPFGSMRALGQIAYSYAILPVFMVGQYSLEYILKEQGPFKFLKEMIFHPFKTTKQISSYVTERTSETFLPVALFAQPYFTAVAMYAKEIAGYAAKLGAAMKPSTALGILYAVGDFLYGIFTATPKKEEQAVQHGALPHPA